MNRRKALKTTGLAALAMVVGNQAYAGSKDAETKASFDTVMAFMGAMGKGDQKKVAELMADDMVWHNEGDSALPWIGRWEGKEKIFEFMGKFGKNWETKKWENTDAFASGDTVAVFGKMKGKLLKSGKETDEFTFAMRAKVRDGKVVFWNWFEDSFAVSNAYHGLSAANAGGKNDKAVVQTFYDLLSNPGSASRTAAFIKATSDNWESIGNYTGKNKNREQFLGQMGGFAKLIPDLNWKVEEMIQEGDKVVVRSRATGTPVGSLFGVDGKGKGFDILTIDIHTLADGKIASSYHVEDWAGALKQLKGK